MSNEIDSAIAVGFAKGWIAAYAGGLGLAADELMAAADAYLGEGEMLNGGYEWMNRETEPEFWEHYRTITGRDIEGTNRRKDFFSCSC